MDELLGEDNSSASIRNLVPVQYKRIENVQEVILISNLADDPLLYFMRKIFIFSNIFDINMKPLTTELQIQTWAFNLGLQLHFLDSVFLGNH